MNLDFGSLLIGITLGAAVIWFLRGARIAGLESKIDNLKGKPDDRAEEREQLILAVKDVTQEVLEKRTKALTETNEEKIGTLLKPLHQNIKDFQEKLEKDGKAAAASHAVLGQQIKDLKEMNTQIGDEARGLTLALKGESKTQGNWGEVVLERVLELSGLEEGREYEREVTETDEDGKRKRPDVIVHLPADRQVVIDSKVSITAYEAYCSAEDEGERAIALKEHIASIRTHVKLLTGKNYQHLESLHTLDYVLMFMPIEAALTEVERPQIDEAEVLEYFDSALALHAASAVATATVRAEGCTRYVVFGAGEQFQPNCVACSNFDKNTSSSTRTHPCRERLRPARAASGGRGWGAAGSGGGVPCLVEVEESADLDGFEQSQTWSATGEWDRV